MEIHVSTRKSLTQCWLCSDGLHHMFAEIHQVCGYVCTTYIKAIGVMYLQTLMGWWKCEHPSHKWKREFDGQWQFFLSPLWYSVFLCKFFSVLNILYHFYITLSIKLPVHHQRRHQHPSNYCDGSVALLMGVLHTSKIRNIKVMMEWLHQHNINTVPVTNTG